MKRRTLAVLTLAGLTAAAFPLFAEDQAAVVAPAKTPASAGAPAGKWAPAVAPKPLSNNVLKGLAWLVQHQNPDGGWSEGEEAQTMGSQDKNVRSASNVGDTCIATLALIRAGSTPKDGPHAANIRKGLDFICKEVAASDESSLFVTSVRGTRLQGKIGTYVDTFLAALVLAEVKDQMPDEAGRKQILAALDKVMDKIEKNQKDDGTFGDQGWAPGLGQALAAKSINRAAQSGAKVDEKVRQRTEDYASKQFDAKDGKFSAEGSAGVELYAAAGSLSGLRDADNTNGIREQELNSTLEELKAAPAVAKPEEQAARADAISKAEADLKVIAGTRRQLQAAQSAVVEKMSDDGFVAGFGNNGGEEFLSYMNIGESLVVTGGEDFKKWDEATTKNLNHVQNPDGSWTGHHCITGRTFCTAAALMVLTVDRAPVPLAAQMGRR